ncbi:MAG: transketolase [Candidatus Gracilibacteria bacterium]
MNVSDLVKKAALIRADTLRAIHRARSGHMGSAMSVVEILTVLYYGDLSGKAVMRVDTSKPDWDGQDYFVMCKGQAAPALYVVLADRGFFGKEELKFFRQTGSFLQARPGLRTPGVNVPVMAHGLGLSAALGLAMSLKMERKPNRVFAVIGDGELQNGTFWEAAMAANHYKLDNLILFIDNNGLQFDGPVKAVMDVDYLQDKFESFGWKVIKVLDGHNFDQILDALDRAFTVIRHPICIWCKTVSGRGVGFAEGKSGYHGATLSDAELNEIIPKLEKIYAENSGK